MRPFCWDAADGHLEESRQRSETRARRAGVRGTRASCRRPRRRDGAAGSGGRGCGGAKGGCGEERGGRGTQGAAVERGLRGGREGVGARSRRRVPDGRLSLGSSTTLLVQKGRWLWALPPINFCVNPGGRGRARSAPQVQGQNKLSVCWNVLGHGIPVDLKRAVPAAGKVAAKVQREGVPVERPACSTRSHPGPLGTPTVGGAGQITLPGGIEPPPPNVPCRT